MNAGPSKHLDIHLTRSVFLPHYNTRQACFFYINTCKSLCLMLSCIYLLNYADVLNVMLVYRLVRLASSQLLQSELTH